MSDAKTEAKGSNLVASATAEEKTHLAALWKLVNEKLKTDPDPKTNDDALLRFLRARALNPEKAFEQWSKWRDWRKSFQVDSITPDVIQRPLMSGKAVWRGHDKQKRPCVIIYPRHHWPKESPPEETIKFGVYMVERGIKLADAAGVDQFCVIQDRTGISYANIDWGLITAGKTLASILQDFYAERLGVAYVLGVNRLYWYMYNLIAPFVDKKSLAKIKLLKDRDELKQYFDADQLMTMHGGTDNYDYQADLKTWPETRAWNWTNPKGEAKSNSAMEETVARGSKSSVRIACDENHVVTWSIKTAAHDIGIEIEFWPAQLESQGTATSLNPSATAEAQAAAQKVHAFERHECDKEPFKGTYKCTAAGELCFTFDNTYSIARAKTVIYEITSQIP